MQETIVHLARRRNLNRQKTLEKFIKCVENGKIFIGHQYSTIMSVKNGMKESDIHDLTGEEAAIVGLDFLSLIGAEGTTPENAWKDNMDATEKAVKAGAFMTVSSHFPNFAYSKKIRKNSDGKYDFGLCSYADSKILKPCASEILTSTESQEKFNAALDIVADYAAVLKEKNLSFLFRPFHEDNGGWFWWGTITTAEDFKKVWIYIYKYFKSKGIDNILYSYSPNGPFESPEEYMRRYPGDEYVDFMGFDYYDDCNSLRDYSIEPFEEKLKMSCRSVRIAAETHGKIPVISEVGVRVKVLGADSIVASGNPVTGSDWYERIVQTAVSEKMAYVLFWGNYGADNFFVPYKGHEMEKEFMNMVSDGKAVFSKEAAFDKWS